ncbi:hypothetical protein DB30_00463 [Enhygromyxa salina]|uniref:Uncharacterized protein n=1 Tax=Enhygromyxa salina TaxID=215803 RepID=A0A0C2CUH7_9BACT|nr:hypothetical protein [Enhygromyxa salina]KIG13240.1 hypothetical protein DB30_00463 [Enhygromyxa salina]
MNDDPNDARLVSPGRTLFPLQQREWGRVKKIVFGWTFAVVFVVVWLELRPLVAGLVAAGLTLVLNVAIEAALRRRARAGKNPSQETQGQEG